MAYSPSDTQFAVVGETVSGVTPATPAFKIFPHNSGDNITSTSEWIDSPAVRPNRGSNGGRRAAYSTAGTLNAHFQRDASIDLLLASGFSGAWNTATLKGGATDSSVTVEKLMKDSVNRYHRVLATQVSKTTFSGKATDNVMVSFDLVGTTFTNSSAIVTGATYADPATTLGLAGEDVTMTLGGLTVDFVSFETMVEFDRSAQFMFGSTAARAIGTAGQRKVSGSVEFFMPSTDYFASLAAPAGLPLVITMGSGVNGYRLTVPAAQFRVPEDSEDGSAIIVKADFSGANTTADGTNIILERLS
ncbi:hypothetical protein GRI62_11880 [Erythrobacter arachoides]|uniref:Phage tail protein n=1 Tax=Aurantiacibacter arachoides TaxID=1850444 RepID=A0A845A2C8_9SPHN|nr:phage tail tube protein [Aurantiacibacter arachoides]MXO94295.1 hypothetical protein [Aurantiacibacter arachoides]GGD64576.1 hypothetical protein GCM10011411_26130 [Aurantiacibacter arachoides]